MLSCTIHSSIFADLEEADEAVSVGVGAGAEEVRAAAVEEALERHIE